MDYLSLLEDARSYWQKERSKLSKQGIKHISDKDNPAGRKLEMFSLRYMRRTKLIDEADLFYAYVFRDFRAENESNHHFSTWMLFSPDRSFSENPELFSNICKKLNEIKQQNRKETSYKNLWIILNSNYSEAFYVLLPEELTDNKPVYLQTAWLRIALNPDFRLGINLILANKKVSKEALYLPQQYWCQAYADYYLRKGE